MQVIDPRHLPTSFTITQARGADLGEHPRLLDGFLYVGANVLFSEPGLGKSMLSAAVEEHLAFGRPFGPWIPEHAYRCLVLDFEGDMRLASERSLTNTPWGLLPSDHGRPVPADIEYETEFPGDGFFGRLGALEQRLDAAARQGQPYAYVRIDTMRLFLGSKPHGVNAYEWDAMAVGRLNRLALDYNVALVLVHHTNKAGEVSGSTGVAGSAVVVAQLKRNPDNDDECLLLSHKVRVDSPFRYPVVMDERGRWEFTEDITPTQAALGGTKRALVDLLTHRGPKVMQDIRATLPETNANTIKAALRRLSAENIAVYRRGQWQLTQATIAEHRKCIVCGTVMEVYEPGQAMHPTCKPDPQEQETVRAWLGTPTVPPARGEQTAPAEHTHHQDGALVEEDQEEDEHPEAQRFPAIREMTATLDASRMKPLRRVRKEERENAPWSLVTERLDGHFRSRSWTGQAPEGTKFVALFDRNGSYPSAMSSVPVAPNALTHTGPLGADPLERKDRAGLFQIRVPEWTDARIPHPLGRTAEVGVGELTWITSSHMDFLDKMARDGVLPVLEVLDSWTGRKNGSLFDRYYKWARTVREQTRGTDAAVEAKRSISKAIRLLHPRSARSPFWRPDWHKTVLAQASVRHWVKAYQAVEQGAQLLSIGAVDEVAFAVPADVEDPQLWVPPGYRLGAGFGEVKHKELLVGDTKPMSPVTIEQWQERGRGKR